MVKEKRHNYAMKDFLVPIVAGVVLGGLTAYTTVKFNEGETKAWRQSVEKQITAMEILLRAVQANQLELASRGQWMVNTDERLDELETDVKSILSSRYSKADADRDVASIIREIQLRHGEKPNQ